MSSTYLEYGDCLDSDIRVPLRMVEGKDAYDLWHIAVRFKEMIYISKCLDKTELRFTELPRLKKFLGLYCAYCADRRITKVFELGSSLLEIASGLALYEKYYSLGYSVRLSETLYIGIERNEYMQHASLMLDKYGRSRVFASLDDLESDQAMSYEDTLFHDLGTASYVFDDACTFGTFLKKFRAGFFMMYGTTDDTYKGEAGSFVHTVFNIEELQKYLGAKLYRVFEQDEAVRRYHRESNCRSQRHTFYYFGDIQQFRQVIDSLARCEDTYEWLNKEILDRALI